MADISLNWAILEYQILFLTSYNGYLYACNSDDNKIAKISLTDPANDINHAWAVTGDPTGISIYDGYVYASNQTSSKIAKISLTDPANDNNQAWADTAGDPLGITIYNGYLYVALTFKHKIAKISLTDPANDNNQTWATTGFNPTGVEIYNGYLYVSNYDDWTIGKISLTDPANDNNQTWATTDELPAGMLIYDGYLYVTHGSNQIGKISLTDPINDNNRFWKTIDTKLIFWGCIRDGPYLYVSSQTNDFTVDLVHRITRIGLEPIPPMPPMINICFPAGTPIQIDQGIIAIEKINPDIHTINHKLIIDITKTISPDNFLVCFKKNSLGLNYPTKKTIMSKHHKVYYQGKLHKAMNFLGKFKNVKKVKYSGEILYNVLMEDYSQMSVNNLICETLHPENIAAKLYSNKCKYTDETRDIIVVLLKVFIKNKDYKGYNRLVERC